MWNLFLTKYKRHISADLKIEAMLIGLQFRYIMHCCFICEWDSTTRNIDYIIKQLPLREQKNKEHKSPDISGSYKESSHTFGSDEQLRRTTNKEGHGFQYVLLDIPLKREERGIIDKCSSSFQALYCNMSLRIHFFCISCVLVTLKKNT